MSPSLRGCSSHTALQLRRANDATSFCKGWEGTTVSLCLFLSLLLFLFLPFAVSLLWNHLRPRRMSKGKHNNIQNQTKQNKNKNKLVFQNRSGVRSLILFISYYSLFHLYQYVFPLYCSINKGDGDKSGIIIKLYHTI